MTDTWTTISTIAPLPADWDGMGGAAVTPATVARATYYLGVVATILGEPKAISPTPSGSILAHWQHERTYRECEIGEKGPAEWMSNQFWEAEII